MAYMTEVKLTSMSNTLAATYDSDALARLNKATPPAMVTSGSPFVFCVAGIKIAWRLGCLGMRVRGETTLRGWLRFILRFIRMCYVWWRMGDLLKAQYTLDPNLEADCAAFMASDVIAESTT